MNCNKTILKIFDFVSVFVSVALAIAAAVLLSVEIITTVTAGQVATIFVLLALGVAAIGVVALFFPCSLKCGYTRTAMCKYFVKIATAVAGVILTGLIILALNLLASATAAPIFFGIITFFFVYLGATLLQFGYVTISQTTERYCQTDYDECDC